jgi:hypothetical protein
MNTASRLILLLFILGLALAAGSSHSAAAVPPMQANLLSNPSFEEPYSSGVAQGWAKWHEEKNSSPKPQNCSAAYSVLPKWEPEVSSAGLILDGARSQHVGNSFDTWHGGVFMTLPATQGTTYRFSFWATGRASNDQYPAPSNTEVNMGVRAGIDPNGSGIWYDGDVVWGGSGSPHMAGSQGNWQQFTVEATAAGTQISVYVQADFSGANQCREHLDMWFDRAELVVAGPPPTNTPPPPPPQPVVTNTPVPPPPTDTPAPTPTSAEPPTATPTHTPPPPQGGAICANAFADANANGLRDVTEGYMAGVTITVSQSGAVVAIEQGVTTGSPTAICFENMPAGAYDVTQSIPPSLEMTTAATAAIQVTNGTRVSLEFGSRVAAEDGNNSGATVSPTATTSSGTPPADQGEPSTLAIVGLAAIALAVVLLVVLVVVVLRQPK